MVGDEAADWAKARAAGDNKGDDKTRSDAFLCAETATTLGPGNEFGVPADRYYVNTAFDVDTGRRAAVWVSGYQQGYVERVFRAYELATGKVRREHRFDWAPEGGKREGWLRKTVRTFDTATGKQNSKEVLRFGTVTDEAGGKRSGWLKVEAEP